MSDGYIKLHRRIQQSDAWFDEPFTRAQAWVDMLLNASYTTTFVRIRGIRVDLKPGQVAISEVEYAKRWKWSRGKVRRFLSELSSKTVQQIEQQKTNVTTVVTILNWNSYQGNGTSDGTPNDTADGQQTEQQADTYKKVEEGKKKVKEGKKKYGEFLNVLLTDDEYAKLTATNGKERTVAGIEILGDWMKRTGKSRKNHYACMKSGSWVWEKVMEVCGGNKDQAELNMEEALRGGK